MEYNSGLNPARLIFEGYEATDHRGVPYPNPRVAVASVPRGIRHLIQTRQNVGLPEETQVWELSSDQASDAFEVLSSETARNVLDVLYEEPMTASAISRSLDLSLQNVNYHLQNLRQANLIRVAATEYSEQGNEMKVYAPCTNAVLLMSSEPIATRVRSLLGRLLPSVIVFGIATLVFHYAIVDRILTTEEHPQDDITLLATAGQTEADAVARESTGLIDLPIVVDPWVLFLIGGLFAFTAVLVMHLGTRRRDFP